MQKVSELLSDGFVEFDKKLTRLGFLAKTLQEETRNGEDEINFVKMQVEDCPGCHGDGEGNASQPHIQDLCPADREKIAQLVAKLAESTQARHKAEAELAEIRSENEALISRYEICCNEHEMEKSRLKEQLDSERSRAKILKDRSSRSLDALGEQLSAQETEFAKLTDTVRDLLREKIQLQNALIDRESRARIAEAKLDRAKETLEMEKLLFMKEHVKSSMTRTLHNRACQTLDQGDVETVEKKSAISSGRTNVPSIKRKNDLEDPSADAIILRSLFFQPNTYDDDDENSPLNLLYCQPNLKN